jgi:hypothetical protein
MKPLMKHAAAPFAGVKHVELDAYLYTHLSSSQVCTGCPRPHLNIHCLLTLFNIHRGLHTLHCSLSGAVLGQRLSTAAVNLMSFITSQRVRW